ncbi:uncharacterized protein LOC113969887 [Neopelma chrysocephalum]|uniref:uncharacterized protein LOC113969887 n=1 Tax=Neopelma chrysocephalum TaxID=114329 RepID=UPI000FCD3DDA|nr:uncharacterized protein LOC113969887 [Neopelma chrysocephalum]
MGRGGQRRAAALRPPRSPPPTPGPPRCRCSPVPHAAQSAFATRNRPVCRWGAPRGALQGPWGRDPGSAARPRAGPLQHGRCPSARPPERLPPPAATAPRAPSPANPGPRQRPARQSRPAFLGAVQSRPAFSMRQRSRKLCPLSRGAAPPRRPLVPLRRCWDHGRAPRRGTAPLAHVPLRRCRCRRLCFRSRACPAAAPDRPCWDQGGRVSQLRAHVPSGSSSGRRGGGGSGGGPFNGAAVEQALPAQLRRGAAPFSTSPPAFPSGAGLGAFASGSGEAAPALPRRPQALLKGRVGGPRSRPIREFSREKGREAGSGRERSSPWERGLRGQRGSWGRAGRERVGGDWRGRTLPGAGIGWAGTRGAGLCGPRAINGVGGGLSGQFGGGAGGGAGAAGAGAGSARPLGRGAAPRTAEIPRSSFRQRQQKAEAETAES